MNPIYPLIAIIYIPATVTFLAWLFKATIFMHERKITLRAVVAFGCMALTVAMALVFRPWPEGLIAAGVLISLPVVIVAATVALVAFLLTRSKFGHH